MSSANFMMITPITVLLMAMILTVSCQPGWDDAHATFYGDIEGGETRYGACGYDTFGQGYGYYTTALSTELFNDGASCGSCYELYCVNSRWCKDGRIKVTATNFCPPSTGPAAWCNTPLKHFDLTQYIWLKIGIYEGGIVPVKFRRISCVRQGGIKFKLAAINPYWLLVLVYNVGGDGQVSDLKIKGSQDWVQMTRNWGQNWQAFGNWQGQRMSFMVGTSDGRKIEVDNVVPPNWQLGQSFEARVNF